MTPLYIFDVKIKASVNSGRSLSDSPTQPVTVGFGAKSEHSPQSSDRWKDHLRSASTGIESGNVANSNNDSTSHYQVPTRRYPEFSIPRPDPAQAVGHLHRDFVGSKGLATTPENVKYGPAKDKQNPRKTAL